MNKVNKDVEDEFVQKMKKGDMIEVWVKAGGGGGHEL